jgi:hypothetical protein
MAADDALLIAACTDAWEKEYIPGTVNKNNCSGFVKAVALKMNAKLPEERADGLIDYMKEKWSSVASALEAKNLAVKGTLVIGGLKSTEQKKLPTEGHVVVIVDGELYHSKYPKCWCGSTGHAQSQGDKSVGEVFATADRDKVAYFTPIVQTTRATPTPFGMRPRWA